MDSRERGHHIGVDNPALSQDAPDVTSYSGVFNLARSRQCSHPRQDDAPVLHLLRDARIIKGQVLEYFTDEGGIR